LETPDIITPVGVKNDRGIIEPFPMEVDQSEVCFVGVTEVVPARLAELVRSIFLDTNQFSIFLVGWSGHWPV